jgi:hypothetical protein
VRKINNLRMADGGLLPGPRISGSICTGDPAADKEQTPWCAALSDAFAPRLPLVIGQIPVRDPAPLPVLARICSVASPGHRKAAPDQSAMRSHPANSAILALQILRPRVQIDLDHIL